MTSTLEAGRSNWVMGVFGAVAAFTVAKAEEVEAYIDGDAVTGYLQIGAMRLKIDDDIQAVTVDPPD